MDGTPSGYGRGLRLPEALRPELRIPLGRLLDEAAFRDEVPHLTHLATVGDYVTDAALTAGGTPRVALVDLRIKRVTDRRVTRQPYYEAADRLSLRNPAGTIAAEAWHVLEGAFRRDRPVVVRVEGEEDLLALVAIALAPAGWVVAYGLPDRGAVLVDITGEARGRADAFLARMEVADGG